MAREETGTVKWFDVRKQYGFIKRDIGGNDVFVHSNGMADLYAHSLAEGERFDSSSKRDRYGRKHTTCVVFPSSVS